MSQRVPQVIVTLSPEGALRVELPGPFATRRAIDLTAGQEGESLRRILQGQLADQIEIGLDGAPTSAQLTHWERHADWPRDSCRFCIAEGRISPSTRRKPRVLAVNGEIVIRQIPAKAKGPRRSGSTAVSAEELDL